MSGFGAFQATPHAFQDNAFQAGVTIVAGDYSLGSPSFASPTIQIKYPLSVNAYITGPPSFATPICGTAFILIHVNSYSLGSPSFALPSLRSSQFLHANAYTLGPPLYGTANLLPDITQTHRMFVNAMALGSPSFATPKLTLVYHLVANSFTTSGASWAAVGPVITNYVFSVNPYWLGSSSFAFPRLPPPTPLAPGWPPTYLTQIEQATLLLQGWVNAVLASITNPAAPVASDALRIGNALRVNADAYLRGNNLGGAMQSFMTAVDKAGAAYLGLEQARKYLMDYAGTVSEFAQIVLRGALVMTLSSETRAIAKMSFRSQEDAQAMVVSVKQMFDEATALGIDELNDPTIYQSLIALSGATIKHLATTALQLPRYVAYAGDMPMPSLYLANRIYADGSRFVEIEQENDVIHPAFVPIQIRVLSNAGR